MQRWENDGAEQLKFCKRIIWFGPEACRNHSKIRSFVILNPKLQRFKQTLRPGTVHHTRYIQIVLNTSTKHSRVVEASMRNL